LDALDLDGMLREEEREGGSLLPDEDVESLRDLSVDCMQRVNAPLLQSRLEESLEPISSA
jgi:hypothetical protein